MRHAAPGAGRRRASATTLLLLACSLSACAERERATAPRDSRAPQAPRTDDAGPAVVHFVDEWTRIQAVEGSVLDFQPVQEIEWNQFEPVPYGTGAVAVALPWPALPGSLNVTGRDGRKLEEVPGRGPRLRSGAYYSMPTPERVQAVRAAEHKGQRRRQAFAPKQVPARLWLVEQGDFVAQSFEFPDPRFQFRVLARADEDSPVHLDLRIDGEVRGSFALESADWQICELDLEVEPGEHVLRVEARPDAGTRADAGFLASVVWLEVRRGTSDHLVVREEDAAELSVRYVGRNPQVDDPLPSSAIEQRRFFVLAVGGQVSFEYSGELHSIRLGEELREADRESQGELSFAAVPAGLHAVEIEGRPDTLSVRQPMARLIPQLISPNLRLRDFPEQDGLREGTPVASDALDRVLSRMEVHDDRRVAFWLPTASSLETRAELGSGDRLRFAVGIPETPPQAVEEEMLDLIHVEGEELTTPAVDFRVIWKPTGSGEETVLEEGRVEAGRLWFERQVAISAELAGAGLLRFETRAADGSHGIPAAFADPRLVRRRPRGETRPNLLLYLIDTLRADHLSCYGGRNPTSPFLDRLAREGFLFQEFYAVASWTRPSTASVLTGFYPSWHGANGSNSLTRNIVTLAESLRHAGYSTWAAASNVQVAARGVHFDQGFHRFVAKDGLRQARRPQPPEPTSGRINLTVMPWLERNGDEPFFLYLHSLDPHAPYVPPEHFDAPFGTEYRGRLAEVNLVPRENLRPISEQLDEEDVQYVKDVYDNEILYQDRKIEELLDWLDEEDLLENTIVMVVADHGEEFREHGDWDHTGRMWEGLIRVPGILWMSPDLLESYAFEPRVITEPVSQVDVVPGLLDLLAVEDSYPRQGKSFRPLLAGPPEEPWVMYAEEVRRQDRDDLGSLRNGPYKLIWKRDEDSDEVRYRLFDLVADRAELHDLAAEKPEVVAAMLRLREKLREDAEGVQTRLEAMGFGALEEREKLRLDAGALEALEALGYVGDDER